MRSATKRITFPHNMHSVTILVGTSLIACCLAAGGSYNYDRADNTNGPVGGWPSMGQCGGNENSPIDLKDAKEKDIGKFTLTNWATTVTWNATNGGSSVSFLPNSEPWRTSGGGLTGSYTPTQFHLHWGSTNSAGSEHTVDGDYYPAELHLIHRNSSYGTLGDAAGQTSTSDREALAVFGIFLEVQAADNPKLTELISAFEEVKNYSSTTGALTMPSLEALFGDIVRGDYYRYDGGLTTPPCTEIVVWTVFSTTLKIGANQMAKIQASETGSYGTELYRPVVSLGSRTLYYSTDTVSSATKSHLALQALIPTVLALLIRM